MAAHAVTFQRGPFGLSPTRDMKYAEDEQRLLSGLLSNRQRWVPTARLP
jgi:hypothetical protein